MAALYLIKRMVEGYGVDPEITRILDERRSTLWRGSTPTARSWR